MISETFLGAYFWGVYGWFTLGVLMIGIPAIFELKKLISK